MEFGYVYKQTTSIFCHLHLLPSPLSLLLFQYSLQFVHVHMHMNWLSFPQYFHFRCRSNDITPIEFYNCA